MVSTSYLPLETYWEMEPTFSASCLIDLSCQACWLVVLLIEEQREFLEMTNSMYFDYTLWRAKTLRIWYCYIAHSNMERIWDTLFEPKSTSFMRPNCGNAIWLYKYISYKILSSKVTLHIALLGYAIYNLQVSQIWLVSSCRSALHFSEWSNRRTLN